MKLIKDFKMWLSTNQSVRYLATFGIICFLFVGFITSRFFLQKPVPDKETAPLETTLINDKNYLWYKKMVSEDKTEITIFFAINPVKPDYDTIGNIMIEAKLKNSNISKSEINVYKVNDYFYMLNIKNLPKNWTTLRVEVGEEREQKHTLFFFNKDTEYKEGDYIVQNKDFKPTQEYANVYQTLYEIEYNNQLIQKNVTDKQKEYEDKIKQLDNEIAKIKTDYEYKTHSEKQRIDQKVKSIEKEKATLSEKSTTLNDVKKEYEEKILNLQKKLEKQKREYNISL